MLFDGEVPSERVCFVAEPASETQNHGYVFLLDAELEALCAGVSGQRPIGDESVSVCPVGLVP